MSFIKECREFIDGFFDNPGNFSGGFGMLGIGPAESGFDVNEQSAMTVGAVAACQRIISSAVASMRCYVYERMPDGGHKLAVDHPAFNVLSLQPNDEYSAVDFFGAGQVNLLQNGNGYAEVQVTNGGQPQLILRSPFKTQVYRDQTTGELSYKTTDTPVGKERVIDRAHMVHPKNMGVVPYLGLSPIRLYMREVIGTALAAQAYGARLFKNDARPGGYLKSVATVQPAKKLEQIQSWVAGHRGGNNHMPAYLDGGVEWANVGISPDEAQFLQTRQFQRSEIAAMYGVPAHMLGDPTETKATIEQKALEFLLWTVKIWLLRWEQALNTNPILFPRTGRNAGKFFAKFDTSEFERADYSTMLKGLQTGRYAGLIAVDEGRKALGYNPSTAENFGMTEEEFKQKQPGKGLWRPVNMAVAGEDPTLYASGGAGAGNGDATDTEDAPVGDDAAPQDGDNGDSRSLAAYLPIFEAALDHLEALNKPNSAVWMKALTPSLTQLAGGLTGVTYPLMLETIRGMKRAGIEAVRAQAGKMLQDYQAIVRAAKAHAEGTQCE